MTTTSLCVPSWLDEHWVNLGHGGDFGELQLLGDGTYKLREIRNSARESVPFHVGIPGTGTVALAFAAGQWWRFREVRQATNIGQTRVDMVIATASPRKGIENATTVHKSLAEANPGIFLFHSGMGVLCTVGGGVWWLQYDWTLLTVVLAVFGCFSFMCAVASRVISEEYLRIKTSQGMIDVEKKKVSAAFLEKLLTT